MKKIMLAILALVMGGFVVTAPAPVMALEECGGVQTVYFKCDEDDGINHILKLVVEIMTIGVGILGVIGISIVGIQYLTAGGNEEKTRKAKRRMFEIVLGIVAYVVLYAALQFLLPDFKPFQ